MPQFSDEYKNGTIQLILSSAIWLTNVAETLSMLQFDFNGRLSLPPVDDDSLSELFRIDNQIQQYQRIAQRIDKRFQELMTSYCENFNEGQTAGEFSLGDETYDFWFEDDKYNLTQREQSKVIQFRS